MPILKSTVRHDVPYAYSVYEKAEIRNGWKVHKASNLRGIKGNERYFSCAAMCEDEALVLTALLMRKIDNSPANFYYGEEWKRLFMHCYSAKMHDTTIKMHYDKIIYEFVGRSCLKNISSDLDGQPLFWNRTGEAKRQVGHLRQKNLFLHSYVPMIGGHDFPFRL